MRLDFVSDITCPWCAIGLASLEQAIARHGWLTAGAIVASTLWALASIAFSVYLANFGTYNRIYGSIGAIIALLMWFYISAYVVLFGGVLNAEISRLRAQRRRGQ